MRSRIIKTNQYKGYTYHIRLVELDLEKNDKYWFCGYVAIPSDNKFYEKAQSDNYLMYLDVHGGITFADVLLDAGEFCIGFDCHHFGDDPLIENEEYVELECQRLIDQIIDDQKGEQ